MRETGNKRPMDKLGRAGAVRERKGEIHELNGHQFVTRRFYHIMKCALCGDFMTNLTYQCEGKNQKKIVIKPHFYPFKYAFFFRLRDGMPQEMFLKCCNKMCLSIIY